MTPVTARIDLPRFEAAVKDGLRLAALAERFGISQRTARRLARKVRAGKGRTT